jgi:hypothetical protein
MPKTTPLASGTINGNDQLKIGLREPDDLPPAILIRWPTQPTVTTPTAYDAVAANVMRLLANAVIELAALRVGKRL